MKQVKKTVSSSYQCSAVHRVAMGKPGPNLAKQSTFASWASPGLCSLKMPSASEKSVSAIIPSQYSSAAVDRLLSLWG